MSLKLKTVVALLALFPVSALADGARDWVNAPVDRTFTYFYYSHADGYASFDNSLPITGGSLKANVPIFRIARTFDIGGRVSAFQLVIPYARLKGSLNGTSIGRSISGVGDIQAIFATNLYGAPSMTLEQIMAAKPQDYLAASVTLTMPTGQYDRFRQVNVGKNRWAIKPQLSWGKYFTDDSLLAINTNVQFFSENDEYMGLGKLRQDPIFTLEAHYSKNLHPALWVSADAFYHYGGETKRNGVKQGDRQSTLLLGLSANMNISLTEAISVSYAQSVAKESYTPKVKTFSISFSKMW